MTKILRKYTTIPEHLYVKRNADSQLKLIIEEMDRPGYVLVARQMGKTNLLLNAKRELQSNILLIVYIDLSMIFKKEREYYRNIIDTILETHEERFAKLGAILRNKRELDKIPPHREHFNELREVLKYTNGRLVIILDEIDALRTMDYSDKVFAQIRSMYFTRTSYPEFENLTYILSGVIEPSDLIKDKNKSPFNIGEKIYLDDFTEEEHNQFIKKSHLNISSEISDEIFVWTQGNPRLTFDICSEVEDFIYENGDILKRELARIIHNKYLITFDIAPIDHIRTLVRSNNVVRNAVKQINNKSNGIADDIKRKLYLYGIITSSFNLKVLKIKNPIIERALSNEWINDVNESKASLIDEGIEKVKSKDYSDAISMFEEYLNSTKNISQFNRALANHQIGVAHYHNNQYENAIIALNKCKFPIDTISGEEYHYTTISLLGRIYFYQNKIESCKKCLNDVCSNYKKSFAYRNALYTLSIIYFIEKDYEKSISHFIDLEKELEKEYRDITDTEKNRLISFVYYYLSRIHFRLKNTQDAIEYINKSKACQIKDYYPILLLQEYKIEANPNLLVETKDFIIRNQLYIAKDVSEYMSFNKNILFKILILLFRNNETVSFDELLEYSYSDKEFGNVQKQELLVKICRFARYENDKIDLLKHIISFKEINMETRFIAYEELAFFEKKSFQYYENYLKIFQELKKPISLAFLRITINNIEYLYFNKEYHDSLNQCIILLDKLETSNSIYQQELLVVYYWLYNNFIALKDNAKVKLYANKGLELIETYEIGGATLLDTENVQIIKNSFLSIQNETITRPVEKNRKHGRNEIVTVKYIDGVIKTTKYKKVIQDVELKKCFILK